MPINSTSRSSMPVQVLNVIILFLSLFIACALAGDQAKYRTNPSSSNYSSHRQDVCGRYDRFRSGEIELKDALSGIALRPVFVSFEGYDEYIDSNNPGIPIELLDLVAERANFTWRKSFGVTEVAGNYNVTWTELLLWQIDNYDITIDGWDHSVERMERGVTYTEPWSDASFILIDRRRNLREVNAVDPFNWTKPFEPAVWGMIALTIFLSALVYQLIEYLNGEREDRSLYQWFSDNIYLSVLNFSQNFEYAPTSLAGRIFGVSMTLWALVIMATYTANLASLFVDSRIEPILVDSMEAAVVYGYRVCTVENTNLDFYIRDTYPKAHRVTRVDDFEMFKSLRNGECELAATYSDVWHEAQVIEEYNPHCDLEWVGGEIRSIKSGFAVIADAGDKCSSLVRHVVNLFLVEIVEEGILAELRQKYQELSDDGICSYDEEDEDTRDRRLQSHNIPHQSKILRGPQASSKHRVLKSSGGTSGGGAPEGDPIDSDTLTLQQMAGTFILHWGVMAVAVVVSCFTAYGEKNDWFMKEGQIVEKVIHRNFGPIIGMPPPVNTYVVRSVKKDESALEDNENVSNNPVRGDNYDIAALGTRMNEMQKALDAQTAMMQEMRQFLREPPKEHFV
ncbi:receptor ionotropic, NMDA 1 [Seminavis robusta]|uniref:Receptor ionotropic, NMDA 1 n=1 Tax=Seminavis robusta TaxID=568900 RepID=A0A9N8EH11_9STRA|nr:receptor ionotropic, NMDA 1 [Seminavis robusta]|eukprot:Sro990_g228610.1 receptor ionotropic, NMDA 1 (622) ;mRNA; f:26933-28798